MKRYEHYTDDGDCGDELARPQEESDGEWVKHIDLVKFAHYIMHLCGNPDPAQACRNVIAACKEEAE